MKEPTDPKTTAPKNLSFFKGKLTHQLKLIKAKTLSNYPKGKIYIPFHPGEGQSKHELCPWSAKKGRRQMT